MRHSSWHARLYALSLVCACEPASSDPGLRAKLHVSDAEFVARSFPGDHAGPSIVSLQVPHSEIMPARRAETVTGALQPSATAVAIGLEGDVGYYVVVAGAPTIDEPDYPTFSADITFSASLQGAHTLHVAAADETGRYGASQDVALSAVTASSASALVVRLRWDTEADLDLHVVTPTGDVVWARNVNSAVAPSPGAPPSDPAALQKGGLLGFDSNAGCVIDGRREESVTYTSPAPAGRYRVLVATASLCGQASAHYRVEVFSAGVRIGRGDGIATMYDARVGQSAGDGTLAASVVLP